MLRTIGFLAFVAASMLLSGAACLPGGPVELATTVGCRGVAAEHHRAESLLWVSARDCLRGHEVLGASESFELLASAAWRSRGAKFGLLRVTIYRSAEEADFLRARTVELRSAQLAARWGERPERLNVEGPSGVEVRDALWVVLIPAAGLVMVVVMILYVRALRSGRIMIVWLPW